MTVEAAGRKPSHLLFTRQIAVEITKNVATGAAVFRSLRLRKPRTTVSAANPANDVIERYALVLLQKLLAALGSVKGWMLPKSVRVTTSLPEWAYWLPAPVVIPAWIASRASMAVLMPGDSIPVCAQSGLPRSPRCSGPIGWTRRSFHKLIRSESGQSGSELSPQLPLKYCPSAISFVHMPSVNMYWTFARLHRHPSICCAQEVWPFM